MENNSRYQRSGVTKGLPDLNPDAGIKMELRTITYNIKFLTCKYVNDLAESNNLNERTDAGAMF